MTKGLITPHLLLASSNPVKMIRNLNHLLAQAELDKLTAELDRNVRLLFELGLTHYNFASSLNDADWRQKVSRLYYGAYNVRRSISLKYNGTFSTDNSDHKNVDQLPDTLNNKEAHSVNLRNFREDRNLCDYSHQAVMPDLVQAPADWQAFAQAFIADSRVYLAQQGVIV